MKRIISFILIKVALATYKNGLNKNGMIAALIVLYNPIISGILIFLLSVIFGQIDLIYFLTLSILVNLLTAFWLYFNFQKVESFINLNLVNVTMRKREFASFFSVLMILLSGAVGFLLAGFSSLFN